MRVRTVGDKITSFNECGFDPNKSAFFCHGSASVQLGKDRDRGWSQGSRHTSKEVNFCRRSGRDGLGYGMVCDEEAGGGYKRSFKKLDDLGWGPQMMRPVHDMSTRKRKTSQSGGQPDRKLPFI
jgi:hypothetical protein